MYEVQHLSREIPTPGDIVRCCTCELVFYLDRCYMLPGAKQVDQINLTKDNTVYFTVKINYFPIPVPNVGGLYRERSTWKPRRLCPSYPSIIGRTSSRSPTTEKSSSVHLRAPTPRRRVPRRRPHSPTAPQTGSGLRSSSPAVSTSATPGWSSPWPTMACL